MGSVITSLPGLYDQTSIAGTKKPQMTFIQFVPGIVVSVVTSADSDKCEGDLGRLGSIRALPHIGGKGLKKKSMIGEEHRYFPLLRGIQETPVVGDPVLLATFGGRQYYLGPLNTQGSPNFNSDVFEYDEIRSGIEAGAYPDEEKITPLFVERDVSRLQKPLNSKLDNPLNPDEFISSAIHGDLVLEGRHGNSLRIGSRNTNPNIVISNGRAIQNPVETSLDGTILSITHRGTIREHFNRDHKDDGESSEIYKFALADDELPKGILFRSISKCLGGSIHDQDWQHLAWGGVDAKGSSYDVESKLYGYSEDQLFASSGRITFNARTDSIFLSAYDSIHIGCGSSMTFSTSKNILIEAAESVMTHTPVFKVEAENWVYINGKDKITLGNPHENGDVVHAAVLGDSLVTQLSLLMGEIKNLALATSEAIENRKKVGASVDIMVKVVSAMDKLMGQNAEGYPETLGNLILSKKVFLKV